jgi:hypothetical protein
MGKELKCSVEGCNRKAVVGVLLFGIYPAEQHVFFAQDYICPYLCEQHKVENEKDFRGKWWLRGVGRHKFTNRQCAQNVFTTYCSLS